MTNKSAHVLLGTPSYDGKVTLGFLTSCLEYTGLSDVKIGLHSISGDSLVTRARNQIITQFYEWQFSHDFTHLFWQDADVYVEGVGLERMVSRGLDVIAAPVPMKQPLGRKGFIQSTIGVYEEVEPMLYKATHAATGAFLMSKKAVIDVVEYCEKNDYIYYEGNQKLYDVFRVTVNKNKFYLSEDWYLCDVLRKLGYEIYVDSSFTVSHIESARHLHTRPAVPLSENVLNNTKHLELPEELQKSRWATNDLDLVKNVYVEDLDS